MQKERFQSEINQNFGTVCHTEVCLTFSRLAAKLSEMITKFRGCSLKIQHWSSFDLNGLKNGPSLHFRHSLKPTHLCQRLMEAMNCRQRSQKNQKSSAVRSDVRHYFNILLHQLINLHSKSIKIFFKRWITRDRIKKWQNASLCSMKQLAFKTWVIQAAAYM